MKKIIMIQTFDNVKHNTSIDAKKHLEKLYGDLILNISKKLLNMKYSQISNYIDSNLNLFLELKKIKDDFAMCDED